MKKDTYQFTVGSAFGGLSAFTVNHLRRDQIINFGKMP